MDAEFEALEQQGRLFQDDNARLQQTLAMYRMTAQDEDENEEDDDDLTQDDDSDAEDEEDEDDGEAEEASALYTQQGEVIASATEATWHVRHHFRRGEEQAAEIAMVTTTQQATIVPSPVPNVLTPLDPVLVQEALRLNLQYRVLIWTAIQETTVATGSDLVLILLFWQALLEQQIQQVEAAIKCNEDYQVSRRNS